MEYVKAGEKITIKCSVGKCPRTKKYITLKDDESTIPAGTVVIKMKCPWHEDGDFDEEQYYDKDGKELFWQPNY